MCYIHLSPNAVICNTPITNPFSKADIWFTKTPNSGGGGGGSLWAVTPYIMKCSLLTV